MSIVRRGSCIASSLLSVTVGVAAQEIPQHTIIPGNDQKSRQQEEARERERAISAPGVRSSVTASTAYPTLPSESPCFRIDRFSLDVPDALPTSVKVQGASALPLDRFAFVREFRVCGMAGN